MTVLPRTLVDDEQEALLLERGWVVLPFLSPGEVASLRSFYQERAQDGAHNPVGAHDPTYAEFSVIHSHPSFREAAFDQIVRTSRKAADRLLQGHRPLVANFVNKAPGTGVVPLHQNWYVVDEARYRSVSVWIALVDCDDDNGTLQLLAGSHSVFREPRGMWAYEAFVDLEHLIGPSLESVHVRAGDAIILDDAVLHYSAPNRSDADRLAIQLIMVPTDATPLFCERTAIDGEHQQVNIWEVDERFFWEFWHGAGDRRYGQVIDQIELPAQPMGADQFLERFALSSVAGAASTRQSDEPARSARNPAHAEADVGHLTSGVDPRISAADAVGIDEDVGRDRRPTLPAEPPDLP